MIGAYCFGYLLFMVGLFVVYSVVVKRGHRDPKRVRRCPQCRCKWLEVDGDFCKCPICSFVWRWSDG